MNQALSRSTASVEMQAYLLGLMSVAAFALTLPCAKVLAGQLSAMQIGLFRSMLAALAALPILWFTRSARPNASQVKRLLLLSLGIVYGFPILTAGGMRYVPVGHGGGGGWGLGGGRRWGWGAGGVAAGDGYFRQPDHQSPPAVVVLAGFDRGF